MAAAEPAQRQGAAAVPVATDVFVIAKADSALSPSAFALGAGDGADNLGIAPVADPGRMADAGFCSRDDVLDLWKQKTRLDKLFDDGRSALYWRAREELYPAGASRPQQRAAKAAHGNRAGEKLAEIVDAVGGFGDTVFRPAGEDTVFLDVCGAPGAWSQYFYRVAAERGRSARGFGFSLRGGTNPLSCTWYEDLLARRDFSALYGADGTGDVCAAGNIAQVVAEVGRQAANLVLADGACGVGSNWGGEHLENYQEIIASRMVLSEVLLMLQVLGTGGCFVCKIFDTFSALTVGVLLIASLLFEEALVVKPRHSRVVNSERYLVGKGFRGASAAGFDGMLAVVRAAHTAWPSPGAEGPWSGSAPTRLLPDALLTASEAFRRSVCEMTSKLCCRQALALRAVLDRTDELAAASAEATVEEPAGKRRRQRGRASAHGRAVAAAEAQAAPASALAPPAPALAPAAS
eukprot:TRINITY_DN5205_c4_g1_i1.p1 TRINITY_DN5205_c4_g1~~TRINITY_DN5205_c4_g1_i1.p1  ORF type:complete len:463 (+),score=118.87 TRINITY_DN5205_c4_g1_i1:110-1498(+)